MGEERKPRRPGRPFLPAGLAMAGLVVLFGALGGRNPGGWRSAAYTVVREVSVKKLEFATRDWSQLASDHFRVRYQKNDPGDGSVAGLVLEAAEEAYAPVNAFLNYSPPPGAKTLIIIYPDRASLNRGFGWGADQSAMGVYWAGSIRVLDPRDWLAPGQDLERVFKASGPLAHEYTHLVLDYRAGGNYPRWFTEGVAQYVERAVTGFEFAPDSSELRGEWYSLAELDQEFDDLPDQNLAYRQALGLVDFLVERSGQGGLEDLVAALGQGRSLDRALLASQQIGLRDLEAGFRRRASSRPPAVMSRAG